MSPGQLISVTDLRVLGHVGLDQKLANFSLKSQIENILDFASQTVSASAIIVQKQSLIILKQVTMTIFQQRFIYKYKL